MAYITPQDYYEFAGSDDVCGYIALAERASDQIDMLTGYKLRGDLSGLSEWVQRQVNRAVCAQLQYLDAHGGMDAFASDGLASATLGRYSFTAGSSASGMPPIAPLALQYLTPTGLLFTGMEVRG